MSNLLTLHQRRRGVYVEMGSVKRIDHDAIIVLLAIMVKFKAARIPFNGNFPRDADAARQFVRSKFFKVLYETDIKWQEEYEFGARGDRNTIYTHAKRLVDPHLADTVIGRVSKVIWKEPRRCPGVFKILIELMHNTGAHAVPGKQGDKHWWLSTSSRTQMRRATVSFAFVDFGVGVFRSLKNKRPGDQWYGWERVLSYFTEEQNPDVFRRILDGEMHETVTGRYFRGKGLPGIREVLQRKGISRLVILTNNVYADVDKDEFTLLKVQFPGTFIYWELSRDNHSLPD